MSHLNEINGFDDINFFSIRKYPTFTHFWLKYFSLFGKTNLCMLTDSISANLYNKTRKKIQQIKIVYK